MPSPSPPLPHNRLLLEPFLKHLGLQNDVGTLVSSSVISLQLHPSDDPLRQSIWHYYIAVWAMESALLDFEL
jgi:hypothetical protein